MALSCILTGSFSRNGFFFNRMHDSFTKQCFRMPRRKSKYIHTLCHGVLKISFVKITRNLLWRVLQGLRSCQTLSLRITDICCYPWGNQLTLVTSKNAFQACVVVQWLRIALAKQRGTGLIPGLGRCHVRLSPWATPTEAHGPRAPVPQQERPLR